MFSVSLAVWVGNLRLMLYVQVNSGKQHTSVHARTSLERLLDELGVELTLNARPWSGRFFLIDGWVVLLHYVSDKIAPALGLFKPPVVLLATG